MTTQLSEKKKEKKEKKEKTDNQPSACIREASRISRWEEHENTHHEFYMTKELRNATMGGA